MGKLKFYSQIFIINQLLKMNFMLDLYFQHSKGFVQGVYEVLSPFLREIWLQCSFKIELNPQLASCTHTVQKSCNSCFRICSRLYCNYNWTCAWSFYWSKTILDLDLDFSLVNFTFSTFFPKKLVQSKTIWIDLNNGSKIVLDLQQDKAIVI